jgi:hypothetical protein
MQRTVTTMAIVEALNRVLRPQDTAYMRALRTVTAEERSSR